MGSVDEGYAGKLLKTQSQRFKKVQTFVISLQRLALTSLISTTRGSECQEGFLSGLFSAPPGAASGDVELLNGVEPNNSLTLEAYIFPEHLDFLELSFTPGNTSATVRTKKPLDADVLASVSETFFKGFIFTCDSDVLVFNVLSLLITSADFVLF